MAQESIAPFEFDEPASQSHTPPNWSIETLEIKPSGKAPKRYGPNAYRFAAALTLSVILPRRGWTLVKKAKNYVYLIPPADNLRPPFLISIADPTADECLAEPDGGPPKREELKCRALAYVVDRAVSRLPAARSV